MARRVDAESIGRAAKLHGGADPVALGNAIHGFLAADTAGLSIEARVALAELQRRAWGLAETRMIDPSALLALGDALTGWVARKWPGRKVLREIPMESRRPMEAGYAEQPISSSRPRMAGS